MVDELARLGLDRAEGWSALLRREAGAAGRGATAVLTTATGHALRLKAMCRGGLVARLWRDRFVGSGRLLANLTLPLEALRRGVRTPRARALLLVQGPPGLWRGWLAMDEISGARDLARRLSGDQPPPTRVLVAALHAVRGMHDAGVEHLDLNLGNLAVVESDDAVEGWILDLDRARLWPGPVPGGRRSAALLRLERSAAKLAHRGASAVARVPPDAWGAWYAGDDRDMARRIERHRRGGRLALALHRLGWGVSRPVSRRRRRPRRPSARRSRPPRGRSS